MGHFLLSYFCMLIKEAERLSAGLRPVTEHSASDREMFTFLLVFPFHSVLQ